MLLQFKTLVFCVVFPLVVLSDPAASGELWRGGRGLDGVELHYKPLTSKPTPKTANPKDLNCKPFALHLKPEVLNP